MPQPLHCVLFMHDAKKNASITMDIRFELPRISSMSEGQLLEINYKTFLSQSQSRRSVTFCFIWKMHPEHDQYLNTVFLSCAKPYLSTAVGATQSTGITNNKQY